MSNNIAHNHYFTVICFNGKNDIKWIREKTKPQKKTEIMNEINAQK